MQVHDPQHMRQKCRGIMLHPCHALQHPPYVYLPHDLQPPFSKRTQASMSGAFGEDASGSRSHSASSLEEWCGLPGCVIHACRDPGKWSEPQYYDCKANTPASEENDCALLPNKALPMRATIRATHTSTAPICSRSGRHLHSTLAMDPILGSNDLHHIH